jgi:hypothetical protein
VGDTFIYGICGDASMIDLEKLKAHLKEDGKNEKLNIVSKKKLGVGICFIVAKRKAG